MSLPATVVESVVKSVCTEDSVRNIQLANAFAVDLKPRYTDLFPFSIPYFASRSGIGLPDDDGEVCPG